jgi:hypothetical protein
MRIAWHAAELCFAPAVFTPCALRHTSSRPSNAAIMSTAATLRYDAVIMLGCMPFMLGFDNGAVCFKRCCSTAEGSLCTAHSRSGALRGCCTCHVLGMHQGREPQASGVHPRGIEEFPLVHLLGRQDTLAKLASQTLNLIL